MRIRKADRRHPAGALIMAARRIRSLLAVALGAGALALGACGGDDDDAEAGGGTLSGTGYEYTLPDGWVDVSQLAGPAADELGLDSELIDSVATVDPDGSFATNVNVATGPTPKGTTLELLTQVALNAIANPTNLPSGVEFTSPPSKPTRTELGGRPAVSFEYEGDFLGNKARLRQVGVLNGGTAYQITFASPVESFAADEGDEFERIADSWRWR